MERHILIISHCKQSHWFDIYLLKLYAFVAYFGFVTYTLIF